MNEAKKAEDLAKKMQTDPMAFRTRPTSYDVFKPFADEFKAELDEAADRAQKDAERLWNG